MKASEARALADTRTEVRGTVVASILNQWHREIRQAAENGQTEIILPETRIHTSDDEYEKARTILATEGYRVEYVGAETSKGRAPVPCHKCSW